MVKYLLSNFSFDMVEETEFVPKVTEITEEEFDNLKTDAVAVIRHPAFARLLQVPQCKQFIRMHKGDVALVVGTNGGKLAYNAKTLPDGLSLKYNKIEILEANV